MKKTGEISGKSMYLTLTGIEHVVKIKTFRSNKSPEKINNE